MAKIWPYIWAIYSRYTVYIRPITGHYVPSIAMAMAVAMLTLVVAPNCGNSMAMAMAMVMVMALFISKTSVCMIENCVADLWCGTGASCNPENEC